MRSPVVMTCAVCAREASCEAAFCSRCGSRLLQDTAAEAGQSPVPSQRSRRESRDPAAARPSFSRTPMPSRAVPAAAPAAAPVVGGTVRLASLLAGLDDVDLREDRERGGEGDDWAGQRYEDQRYEDQRYEDQRYEDQRYEDQRYEDPAPSEASGPWLGGDGEGGPSRRVPMVLAVVALVLGLLVVALLVHSLMAAPKVVVPTGAGPGSPGTAAGSAGSAAASAPAAGARASSSGDTAVVGATAQVPATSPDGRDGAGHPTSYAAAQMLDGDPDTTWRMDGNGAGATVSLTFASPRTITSLGLVNGYAKVDPGSGTDRYTQERRITHVTWTVDGHSYPQALSDGDRSVQSTPVPGVKASSVQLHIDTTTAPGQPAFDKTAISDVVIGG